MVISKNVYHEKLLEKTPLYGHCVFYGVKSWSGVMEWRIGVESNFGVAKILIAPADSVYLTFCV